MKSLVIAACITAVLAIGASMKYADAHPSDGLQTGEPLPNYGDMNFGMPPEASLGDMKFTRPYPAVDALTEKEKYYLFGTLEGPEGYRLQAYYLEVLPRVQGYFDRVGSIPPVLNPAAIAASLGCKPEDLREADLASYVSPISGDYPVLNAAKFAPGQFYIRALTEQEILHFGEYLPFLKSLYLDQRLQDPVSGEWSKGKIIGSVLYYRVYGEHGVIYEHLYLTYM